MCACRGGYFETCQLVAGDLLLSKPMGFLGNFGG